MATPAEEAEDRGNVDDEAARAALVRDYVGDGGSGGLVCFRQLWHTGKVLYDEKSTSDLLSFFIAIFVPWITLYIIDIV